MSEWWTYRLDDFLLFSPRVYWRMVELHNAAFWPLHIATALAGIVIVLLILRRPGVHPLWIAFLSAVPWAFVAWSFFWSRYAEINWAAPYVAPAFALQAVLLAVAGVTGGIGFGDGKHARWPGLLFLAAGVLAYPLFPPAFGRPFAAAETYGIAPDPTAAATLGILLAASGRFVPLLFVIPTAWLLLSGLTLHTMGDAQAFLPFSAAALAIALLLLRRIASRTRS